MILRAAVAEDLPALARIQSTAPEASQWDVPNYLSYECVVAEENGEVIAFLAIRETAPGEHEILNFAVIPSERRRGVARKMLEKTIKVGAWFLEVRESNIAAIGLYEAFGFRRAGRREKYYLNPPEAAIVMKIDS